MKKLLLPILLLILLSCHKSSTGNQVYVCTGRYAKAYHSTTECRGIMACKSEVKTITIEQAKSMRRTPCHYCY